MASSTTAAVSVIETTAESSAVGAKRRKPIKTNKVPQIQVSGSVIEIILCNMSEQMLEKVAFSSCHIIKLI